MLKIMKACQLMALALFALCSVGMAVAGNDELMVLENGGWSEVGVVEDV